MGVWDNVPFVEVPLVVVHCPQCGCSDYMTIRSQGDQGDGVRMRRCTCRLCSSRFVVVEDPAIQWQNDE